MSEAGHPKVSIIMATYNCGHTVREALSSVAAQTYDNWELILCDDGSTDDTMSHLEDFARRHPRRVVLLRNQVNSKLAFSLNRCLDRASGEFVARMDGDDISVPRRIEAQVSYLLSHPEVDLVGSAMQRFDESGLKDVLTLEARPDRFSLRDSATFAHATIMARQRVYDELGGYTVCRRTERGQDRDLWFRFYAYGFIGHNLAEPLYLVREDEAAIRRRSLAVRWQSYRTTLIGYRMLGFPARWYVKPTLALTKGLVPYRLVAAYRRHQHRVFLAASREKPNDKG